MNFEQPTIKRFAFIFNRFKCKEYGSKTASEVHSDAQDFEIYYSDFEDLKSQLLTKTQELFSKLQPADIKKKSIYASLWGSLDRISDFASMEKFVVNLVNSSGIYLKAFSKVFFDEYEYFFTDNKLIRYQANERVFIHPKDEPFVVIWERKFYERRDYPQRRKENNNMPSKPINSYEGFYSFYQANKLKDK